MSDELTEIWDLYLDDGSQSLDTIEGVLTASREEAAKPEAIASLFRAMHTFKGNSRVLGLQVIESRAHLAEDLIGLVRDEGVPLDGEMVELLLEAADALRGMMEQAQANRQDVAEDPTADLVARMGDKLQRCRQGEGGESVSPPPEPEFNDAVVFDSAPSNNLAADPLYRQIFADMARDSLQLLAQTFTHYPTDTAANHSAIVAEAERLRFAAEQIGLESWSRLLGELLTAPSTAEEVLHQGLASLQELFQQDFGPLSSSTAVAEEVQSEPLEVAVEKPAMGETEEGVLRLACAQGVFETLLALGNALEEIHHHQAVPTHCQEVDGLLHQIYRACCYYGMDTAAHLTMALVDLFARIRSGQMEADGLLIHIVKSFIAAMERVFEVASVGNEPDMAAVEALFQEAAGVAFSAGGTVPSSVIETRLGLPRSFHKVLTPESVNSALGALETGQHFYIVRVDLNRDETVAGQFLEWINTGAATVISNTTVFEGDSTLFDFLLASPLDTGDLSEALATLDPAGTLIHLEIALIDRKKGGGEEEKNYSQSGSKELLEEEERTRPRHETLSGSMLEAIGEIVTGQAMLRHTLAELAEEDLASKMETLLRAVDGHWEQGKAGARHYLESVQEKIETLTRIEAQIKGLLDQLQEEAIATRLRPAIQLLAPLTAVTETVARRLGRQVILSPEGEDVSIDFSTLEYLKGPLRALVTFCVSQSIELPEQRKIAGKDPIGRIRVILQERDDRIVVTMEDDGLGIDLDRVIERTRRLGWLLGNNPINGVLRDGYGVTTNSDDAEGGLDLAALAAGLHSHGGELRVALPPGGGVRFVTSLPLATMVLEGMVVRAGEVMYVVPIDAIQRIVHAGSSELMRVTADEGRYLLRLSQSEILPVRFLATGRQSCVDGAEAPTAFTLPYDEIERELEEDGQDQKHLFVVAGKRSGQIAISVDELIGQQSVLIRPLQGYLSGIRSVTGCALLGNGGVGMVLDVGRMLNG